ncbi:hypothetical protein DSM104299_03205 [Baekduia alba]|uniref:hypothetical protein n=1 Tax=Baekduia alba TaxID=2997333 RepID=UPI0023405931|nr:hypothetical protein [Baekduia alba]WCB94468.1 hypothetical protein DSM104299_03205 [Baekduia alba]
MSTGTLSREAIDAAHEEAGTAPEPDVAGELFEDAEGQFVLRIGGQSPTTHKVRIYGGAVEIEPPEDGFQKGTSYVLRVEVVCHKVGLTDERDSKTGDVVGCRDERGLKITGVALA